MVGVRTRLLQTAALALALAASPPGRAAAQTVTIVEQLVDGDGANQYDASISNGYIAFTDDRLGSEDVFVSDSTFSDTLVATGPSRQHQAVIDGSDIVYVDDKLGNQNLYRFNLITQTTTLLDGNGSFDNQPDLSSGHVAFLSGRSGSTQVFTIDLATQSVNPMSINGIAVGAPAIDGTLVVWGQFNGSTNDIFAAHLGEFGAPFIADPSLNEQAPAISGNLITYLNSGQVSLFDLTTSQTTQITNDGFPKTTRPLIAGSNIVYSDSRNGNVDIFLYDLVSGVETELTTNASDQILTDIDGNTVVYHDNRLGNLNVWKLTFTINRPPVADAGPNQAVGSGETIQLTASATDPEEDPIASWQWAIDAAPVGSTAVLSDDTIPNPTFDPDLDGEYHFSVVASDGVDPSAPDSVYVAVPEPGVLGLLTGVVALAALRKGKRPFRS